MFLTPVLSLLSKPHAVGSWLRHLTTAGIVCTSVFGTAMASAADASAVQEITQLLEQGKTNEAAQLVRSQLKQNANDVQMRFLQGVIATEQKNYDQAIQTFTALTRDYPSLPEPYNNLAVLYALKGDDRKATQVLEQAIRTNPSYATAHENLGDLYARLASDAYAKALQLDNSRQAIQPKLALIKQIFPAEAVVASSAAQRPSAPAPKEKPAEPAAPVAAPVPEVAPVPSPAPNVAVAAPVTPPSAPEEHKVQAKTEHAGAAAVRQAEESSAAAQEKAARSEIQNAVQHWANAWAKQDINAYFAAYSDRFKPQNGSSLATWKAERKDRIVGKDAITVNIRDLKVTMQGEQRATATFRQYYAAGAFKATTRKTLQLQREGTKWRIVREETGG